MKRGVVYESGGIDAADVEVGKILSLARPVGIWMRSVGIGLIFISGMFLIWVFWPLYKAEKNYEKLNEGNIQDKLVTTEINKVKSVAEQSEEYRILIPKIGADSKVISEVDPFDKYAYSKALLEGVAEASGLSHPGLLGTTYLFAHSVGNRVDYARYNAVFYLLNKLTVGDDIEVEYFGDKFEYKISMKEILGANDLKYLQPQHEEEILVLQTCYPPGTSWKRLIVVAKRV